MRSRRTWLAAAGVATAGAVLGGKLRAAPGVDAGESVPLTEARAREWWAAWERSIAAEARRRYCDTEMGEQLGWLLGPFLNGFASAHESSGDEQWLERLADWAGAWLRRGVEEPDGHRGWPKRGSGGTIEQGYFTDSLLGEAMAFRPLLATAVRVRAEPGLATRWGGEVSRWVEAAVQCAAKWEDRGAWREVKEGGVWVVLEFGLEEGVARWTDGYAQRTRTGFTHPANKQNHIARWLLALHRATGKAIYRERAEAWWRVMKSRIRKLEGGRRWVWNYWDPAGPWDRDAAGKPRHWVGVHPNGGYYGIDAEGMVDAFEHHCVFDRQDMDALVRTQLEFMWNGRVAGAAFSRLDGGVPDPRWKESPGVLWEALTPYSKTLREVFEAGHSPRGWGGLASTPWYLAMLRRHRLKPFDAAG